MGLLIVFLLGVLVGAQWRRLVQLSAIINKKIDGSIEELEKP